MKEIISPIIFQYGEIAWLHICDNVHEKWCVCLLGYTPGAPVKPVEKLAMAQCRDIYLCHPISYSYALRFFHFIFPLLK
jgi:hypothetical protein